MRKKIAIVGGGPAALAAAFELSNSSHEEQFDITVYQMGWRLGGKCASGRGQNGRIEEHGLHALLGYYHNTFRMIRQCYAELDRDPHVCPIVDFEDAFIADQHAVLADYSHGHWGLWNVMFPNMPGRPGDPLDADSPFTIFSYLRRLIQLLVTAVNATRSNSSPTLVDQTDSAQTAGAVTGSSRLLFLMSVLEVLGLVSGMIAGVSERSIPGRLLEMLDRLHDKVAQQLDQLVEDDQDLYRLCILIDASVAICKGILADKLIDHPEGFDAINHYDWLQWLAQHGAHTATLESGLYSGSLYHITFAYRKGDAQQPAFAAGCALRSILRMFFTYQGSLVWKMNGSLGDVMFVPLYEVLKQRGVKFEFFHRLTHVAIDSDAEGDHVSALEFEVQAQSIDGAPYQPFVHINGLPCWPNAPLYDQLKDAEKLRSVQLEADSSVPDSQVKVLEVAHDFDMVVLGLPVGSIAAPCKELLEHDLRWREMVENVSTVSTQAFQLWMNEDMRSLGWQGAPANLTGFVHPFSSWSDYSHLALWENWPTAPRSIAYFVDVLADSDADQLDVQAATASRAIEFLESEITHLWPLAGSNGGFRWNLLMNQQGDHELDSSEAFASQFWVANTSSSGRFVQSLPGTIKYRISPLDRTWDNLTIAGDWTATGLNTGCVESAVISGRLAAHAVCGSPDLSDIVGYDHP